MALGSIVQTISPVASGGFFNVQASSGQEWIIHNISHTNTVQVQFYNGTDAMSLGSWPGAALEMRLQLHVTNSIYYRLQNTGVNTIFMAFDGIQTNST